MVVLCRVRSSSNRENVMCKPDQVACRAWSGNLNDRDDRDLIGSGNLP